MKYLRLLLLLISVLGLSNLSAADRYGLHQAVVEQDINLVKTLLSKGADINLIGSRKYGYGSALHLAVRLRRNHLNRAFLAPLKPSPHRLKTWRQPRKRQ